MNFILNGQASGDVASTLMANQMDVGALRPFVGDDGQSYMSLNSGDTIVTNAPATLRKDDWIALDTAVLKAAKQRLRFVADLRGAGLTYAVPNGIGSTVLQYEQQSDITTATISMDGLRESNADRPEFNLVNLPLPIIHKDFQFSARQVAASRSGGSPLDTTTAELAGRRVAEEVEKLALGESSSYAYGGGTVYGLKNFPQRLTKAMTTPTSSNHATTVNEVLEMKRQSQNAGYYGPWNLYAAPVWDEFLDEDYSTAKGDNTLRERLQRIDGINSVATLDYLTGNDMILVQNTSDVVREVIGLDVTTVQWESHGGMQLNYKVMAIMVPQLRADFNNNTGIVHGTY
jgi:uncharacterized linocin/CFP29 family protein